MPKNSQKWPVFFFTKIMKPQVRALKNWCCSQNLTTVQKHLKMWGIRNKINLRKPYFSNLSFFNFFLKNVPILQFLSIFTIFGYILTLTQKLMCTKEINDLDDFLAWKYIILGVYKANILLKFWVKVFLKIIVW